MSQEKVLIFDTTLRDGEQSAGAGLTVTEKLEIANQKETLMLLKKFPIHFLVLQKLPH